MSSPDSSVADGPAGKLLVRSRDSDILLLNPDGSQRTPLMPEARNYINMSTCADRYVIFDYDTGTKIELWRTDADGANPTKLTDSVINSDARPTASGSCFPPEPSSIASPSEAALPRKFPPYLTAVSLE